MEFLATEVIKKKRMGLANTKDELAFIINGYTRGEIPDYQMAAWLMAVTLKGMNDEETMELVKLMLNSGLVMDFKDITRPKIDKHSTGGVGDKTTLILGPVVAVCGIVMPTIAGRGLGHTGGTLDKLEAIPGFVTRLPTQKFQKILRDEGLCFMGQTNEICPADQKIYALRDVTSTIESFPLICASIMSKKLAEGIDGLVLDVKTGNGAFMRLEEDAVHLANKLSAIGKQFGKKVVALITNMEEPLGTWIGNALEVRECLRIMRNDPLTPGETRTRDLSLTLAAHMIVVGGIRDTFKEAYKMAQGAIEDGSALRKFEKLSRLHGGDLSALPTARHKIEIPAPNTGFIEAYNTEEVGNAAILLRAGRRAVTDHIDPAAGIQIHRCLGDAVKKGEVLFTLYAENKSYFDACQKRLLGSVRIGPNRPTLKPLILRTLA
jgi:pyrimidine-nucleoside phosphorylase